MKKGEIIELLCQFEQASCEIEGIKCWSARELYPILGYTQWHNFVNTIDKAPKSVPAIRSTTYRPFRRCQRNARPFSIPNNPFQPRINA